MVSLTAETDARKSGVTEPFVAAADRLCIFRGGIRWTEKAGDRLCPSLMKGSVAGRVCYIKESVISSISSMTNFLISESSEIPPWKGRRCLRIWE